MGARNRNGIPVPVTEQPQHHRALDARDTGRPGRGQLGVIGFHSGGVYHQIRPLDIFGAVSHEDGDAVGFNAIQGIALVHIGTADGIPAVEQDFGDGAHPAAADPHKMNMMACIQKVFVFHKNRLLFLDSGMVFSLL